MNYDDRSDTATTTTELLSEVASNAEIHAFSLQVKTPVQEQGKIVIDRDPW